MAGAAHVHVHVYVPAWHGTAGSGANGGRFCVDAGPGAPCRLPIPYKQCK